MLPWKCRMRFWHHCPKYFFTQSPEIFRSTSKNYKFIIYFKKTLPNCSSAQVECSLDNSAKKFSFKVGYFSLQTDNFCTFLCDRNYKNRNKFGQFDKRCYRSFVSACRDPNRLNFPERPREEILIYHTANFGCAGILFWLCVSERGYG